MKAVRIHQHGGPEVLRYEDVPSPKISKDDVLIRVKACALNYLDLWARRGIPGISLPLIPGCDVAGVIEETGQDVKGWSKGDRVVINPGVSCDDCEYCKQGEDPLCNSYHIIGEHVDGGYAEFAKVPARNLMRIPEGFSFEAAAAAPLVFQTAWRALISRAWIRPGEDVLILGAAGGVGTACVQNAKLAGARVFAIASTNEKLEKLKGLGADVLINHTKKDFGKEVWGLTNKRGVDVVIDSIGEATWQKSLRCLARNGRLVTYGATTGPTPPTDLRLVFWRQLKIIGTTMGNRKEVADVMKLIWARKLKPVVDRVFPLQEAARAQQMMENREQFGKLILIP
ncbi:MAG: alcohol dehydrogenase [Candidatus Fraserbacteria bacterium RBG_16_55_9]|uniref:Alcohol dehydrogenase n=1 Tax=Fraserbacteria sp. (strain RBG_16_55_9) TaxID=1817864 RepID=A0A1F5USY4_FRAXR|nr:MAG: alcohol dehydrogenase [Candidatus Fraserbacteria bacterium RBG_16_55_9]